MRAYEGEDGCQDLLLDIIRVIERDIDVDGDMLRVNNSLWTTLPQFCLGPYLRQQPHNGKEHDMDVGREASV